MSNMTMFGVLLKDLIVIDIDGQEFIEFYEGELPALQTCPKECTKTGAHYFFKRTKLCDDMKLLFCMRLSFGGWRCSVRDPLIWPVLANGSDTYLVWHW